METSLVWSFISYFITEIAYTPKETNDELKWGNIDVNVNVEESPFLSLS